jgi:hypothetical protein
VLDILDVFDLLHVV